MLGQPAFRVDRRRATRARRGDRLPVRAVHQVAGGEHTVDVTDATFDSDVLKSGKTVVVDFWAEWCGPCKMVAPVLDEIAGENKDKITVAKLDIDVNQKTAQAYQVMSIPTMIVFQDGKPVKQIVGARPKAALLSDLADYLG